MKFITDFGGLYRISDRNWLRYLKAKAEGSDQTINSFGAKQVGVIHADVSDFNAERAQFELETSK